MSRVVRVAGYVKLAKLWKRESEEASLYHRTYYQEKYRNSEQFRLEDVYIDITGQKEIRRRPEMLRLLGDCRSGRIDCIAAQTRGYLAANVKEFCYLIRLLLGGDTRIEIVTEDERLNIDTIINEDHQREALLNMANDYISLDPSGYQVWLERIKDGIDKRMESVTTHE